MNGKFLCTFNSTDIVSSDMAPPKRPLRGKVYEYFEQKKDGFTCICSTGNSNGDGCGTIISIKGGAGSYASNLKRHLQRHHPIQFKEVEAEAANESKKKKDNVQTDIKRYVVFIYLYQTTILTISNVNFVLVSHNLRTKIFKCMCLR